MKGQGATPRPPSEADDLSRLAEARPALPASPLYRAYGQLEPGQSGVFRVTAFRDEPCSCGGTITARQNEAQAAIDAHNATPQHRAWRASRADAGAL